ncbi:MAG TPA: hypothetical protein VI758_11165, partial [Bacteroidota bacterium]
MTCIGMNVRLAAIVIAINAFAWQTGVARQRTDPATVAIREAVSHSPSGFLQGYRESISGETISYHSPIEYVKDALLVRAMDGNGEIAWKTQIVPTRTEDSVVTFFWLAGLAASKGVHRFEMSIDNAPTLAFTSRADSSEKVLAFRGNRGEQLKFVVTEVDQFGDLFGYMFLTMPANLTVPGHPLTLRVAGAAEQSTAWYMTFENALSSKIRSEGLSLLVARGDSILQLIKVGIEHYGSPATFDVYIDPTRRVRTTISWGAASILLPIPRVLRSEKKIVIIESEGKSIEKDTVVIVPVHQRTFYLLPHSHTDIGYSDYQATVEKNHMRYVDEAIRLAEKTSAYPPEARFKWNVEVMWPLESYINRASKPQKNRLLDAIRKNWIGLNGFYANMLTGLCRPEELIHTTDYARTLVQQFGLTVNTAMISDIPSYTSSTVTALSLAGIKYLSSGPNYMPTNPDGGDRIGYALKSWGDKPFYWESQSGQHRVLFWMAGRGYSWFHGLNMGKLRTASLTTICEYLEELEANHYPYDMVQVRYTVDGDNGPPDPDLSDCVKAWNENYVSPKMVIATSREMFEQFEEKYGSELPVYRGDFTPYWEDGAASTAKEEAMNRTTAEKLIQAEALEAMTRANDPGFSAFYAAWRNVVLFDEHTWGAANSVSEPDSPNVLAQWEYKKAFADDGSKEADALLKKAESPVSGNSSSQAVDVINTTSWPRTDLVMIPLTLSKSWNVARDSKGSRLPSQRLSSGELAVLVKNVSPFGAERIFLSRGRANSAVPDLLVGNKQIKNGSIALGLEETTGSIRSLKWNGHEFVDTLRGNGLNQYFYVPGRDPGSALTDLLTDISVKERGPLVASLLVESAPAGTKSFKREIRLIKGLDRVDIIDTFDKAKVREKESVHIGFPFLVPGGAITTDGGWETVRPEIDQLRGSCKDFLSVQRWVDISNDRIGVTWSAPDAPLVEVGAMTNEGPNGEGHRLWRTTVAPAQNMYSYAMNNYWHTNYKADQVGIVVLRYALVPHGNVDAGAAERFGTEQSQPLLVVAANVRKEPLRSLCSVEPSSVVVTSLKTCGDR